jgi:hypothetical protein
MPSTWDYPSSEVIVHHNSYGACVGQVIFSNHLHQGCEYSQCSSHFATAISDY